MTTKTRKVRYNGIVWESTGALVKYKMTQCGCVLKVVLTTGKQLQSKIEFRIHDNEDVYSKFITVTKFQAKRWMTKSQTDNLVTFETVFRLRSDKNKSFRDRIEDHKKLNQICADDTRIETAVNAIASRSYCEL